MKTKYLLIIILNFFFFNIVSATNIAYFDLNYIINNSKIGKITIERLDLANNQNIESLKKENIILNEEKDEIEKIKNILSKEELANKIKLFNEKLENFNKKQEKMSNDFKNLRQLEVTNLLKKINPIIEKYMLQNDIDIILKKENLYISKNEYDITKELIDLINNEIK